jgi:hypothetical protein
MQNVFLQSLLWFADFKVYSSFNWLSVWHSIKFVYVDSVFVVDMWGASSLETAMFEEVLFLAFGCQSCFGNSQDFIMVLFKLIFLITAKLMKNKWSKFAFNRFFISIEKLSTAATSRQASIYSTFISGQNLSFRDHFFQEEPKKNIVLFLIRPAGVPSLLPCIIWVPIIQSYIIFP